MLWALELEVGLIRRDWNLIIVTPLATRTAELLDVTDRLCGAIVLLEPSDLPALAEILSLYEQIGVCAEELVIPEAVAAASAAVSLIERIIFNEVDDVAISIEVLSRTASALQEIARVGTGSDSTLFPPELGLPSAAVATSVGTTPPFKLPEHVSDDILADFLSNQTGVLEEFESLILAADSGTSEGPDPVLRLLHTLKGESGMLGLEEVERTCHGLEELLTTAAIDKSIEKLLAAKDWLQKTFDWLAGQSVQPAPFDLGGVDAPAPFSPPDSQPLKASAPDIETSFLESDPELLVDFVVEAREHLENADVHLLTVESDPHDEDALNAVFRAFHTIKGVAGFLALDEIQSLAHESENLLDKSRKGELKLAGTAMDVTFDAVDRLKELIQHVGESLDSGEPTVADPSLPDLLSRIVSASTNGIDEEGPAGKVEGDKHKPLGEILVEKGAASAASVDAAVDEQAAPPSQDEVGEILVQDSAISRAQLSEALALQTTTELGKPLGQILVEAGAATPDQINCALRKQRVPAQPPKVGEILVRSGEASAKDVAQALRSQTKNGEGRAAAQVRESVKVDSDRLNQLIDVVGELVIAKSVVAQSIQNGNGATTKSQSELAQLDKVTRELQEIGMSLRMMPVRPTFQKMARLVRDLAKKSGKEVDFHMSGEETELDKSIIDQIGDPLVHMVRNSVDHGLEPNREERIKAGKPPVGRVELRAFHRGGSIYIEIEDDGRGLDREKILAKGIERGLVNPDDTLTDSEVWKLIFEPGFSTAEKITDVSGRGVGMDVVRRNIESLRGSIEIESTLGEGSVFSIRLPLTLAIIDGMVIRVGDERFILPTLSVVFSLRPQAKELSRVVNEGLLLSYKDTLYPVHHIGQLFGIASAQREATDAIIVIVEDADRRVGLVVDELLEQQQIVIKSLGESLTGIDGIAGGTIMPEGNVGLIIDINGLVALANEN
jgi:two-component system chemotaxis sensor kinase CheA